MFEGFDQKSAKKDRRRFGLSLAVSSAVYLGAAGSVVFASAAVRTIVEEEKLVQVEFAPPPPPPPEVEPPPPPAPTPQKASSAPARPKVVREKLEVPDEIPDEKPAEAEGPLPDAPAPGAGQEGFLTGVVGGTGTAATAPTPPPPPPPPKASAPVPDPRNEVPEYPRAARRAEIEGTVVARIWVKADGTVSKVDILQGPEIFHEPVREALMRWRYKPARLPDGTAVPAQRVVQFPFKLE